MKGKGIIVASMGYPKTGGCHKNIEMAEAAIARKITRRGGNPWIPTSPRFLPWPWGTIPFGRHP
jgi:hypothetical protein